MPDTFIEDYLAHHGVLGMRWGHRKPDSEREESANPRKVQFRDTKTGTVTKKKYPIASSNDHVTAHEINKKPVHSLSNAELQQLNQRLQLEQQYSKLKSNTGSLGKIKKGNDTVKILLGVTGSIAGAYGTYKGFTKFIATPEGEKTLALGARIVGKALRRY